MVRQMLISRSQEHPVMNSAAAGGNRMATIMSRTSEDLTIVGVCGGCPSQRALTSPKVRSPPKNSLRSVPAAWRAGASQSNRHRDTRNLSRQLVLDSGNATCNRGFSDGDDDTADIIYYSHTGCSHHGEVPERPPPVAARAPPKDRGRYLNHRNTERWPSFAFTPQTRERRGTDERMSSSNSIVPAQHSGRVGSPIRWGRKANSKARKEGGRVGEGRGSASTPRAPGAGC